MTQARTLFIIAIVLMLAACGGGGAKVQTSSTSTTMGQELMDLNESYKKGILTEKEYNKSKENIMDRYDN